MDPRGWSLPLMVCKFSNGHSTVAVLVHCFQFKLEFGKMVFVEGREPEDPEKNPQSEDENQQQTKLT